MKPDDLDRWLRATEVENLSPSVGAPHISDEAIARLVETGRPLDANTRAHFAQCSECRAIYVELASARPAQPAPPATVPTASTWWWTTAVGGLAVAAAVVFATLPYPGRSALNLDTHVIDGPGNVRGAASVGDRLAVQATLSDRPYHEIRVYLDGVGRVLRCGHPAARPEPSCERRGDQLAATLELQYRGRYRVVLIGSPTPILTDANSADEDLAQHAHTETQTIDVH